MWQNISPNYPNIKKTEVLDTRQCLMVRQKYEKYIFQAYSGSGNMLYFCVLITDCN